MAGLEKLLTYLIHAYVYTVYILAGMCVTFTMCMYNVTCSKFCDLLFPQLLDENAHLIRVRCTVHVVNMYITMETSCVVYMYLLPGVCRG